jgi:CubicO group peptidase (beta-lactamase class C family)
MNMQIVSSGAQHSRLRVLVVTLFVLATGLWVTQSAVAGDLERARPEAVGMSSERLERLSNILHAYVEDDKLPGGVALVARHGKIAYLESFGHRDRAAGANMQDDDIFRIASQTKALISVGVMMLQEEGQLLIADPVGDYLPEFQETTVAVSNDAGGYDVVPADRPVTIRDLLTHTSGVDYGDGVAKDRWEEAEITGWYFADRDEPIRDTVSRIAALPFQSQPGERWVYGYSTDILGAVVEVVSGEPLDEFLRSRIFLPLGMTDTHFYLPESKLDRLVVVYSAKESGGLERTADGSGMVTQGDYVDGPRKSFSGGAGLLSTAEDYARFLQMMLNGGKLDGARILSRKSVQLMTINHIGQLFPMYAGDGTGFGLGFAVVKDVGERGIPGSVGEFSWGGAYHSTYWVDPEEELVVVYMAQLIPTGGVDDHGKLRTLIYQAIVD